MFGLPVRRDLSSLGDGQERVAEGAEPPGQKAGQVDVFGIDEYGCFIDGPQSATFSDPSSYPTGVAYVTLRSPSGSGLQDAILVSLGGANRVDAYAVAPDGSIDNRPFSSTGTRDGTFPADIAAYVPVP